jgi:hypothetical protein
VSDVAVLLTTQERNRFGAPSSVDRSRGRTRPAAITKPSLFSLHECCPVGLLTEQTDDHHGFRVDPPIRSQDSPFQACLDLHRGVGMGGTRQRRPQLPNDRSTSPSYGRRGEGERPGQRRHQREPHESDARAPKSPRSTPFGGHCETLAQTSLQITTTSESHGFRHFPLREWRCRQSRTHGKRSCTRQEEMSRNGVLACEQLRETCARRAATPIGVGSLGRFRLTQLSRVRRSNVRRQSSGRRRCCAH